MSNAELIEVERRCFAETENPLHIWSAYGLARSAGDPIPEWVLRYFDLCRRNIFDLYADGNYLGEKDIPALIVKAVKMDGQIFSRYRNNWIVWGAAVRQAIELLGSETKAIRFVADRYNSTPPTVRRAFKRYEKLFPGAGIFPDEALS